MNKENKSKHIPITKKIPESDWLRKNRFDVQVNILSDKNLPSPIGNGYNANFKSINIYELEKMMELIKKLLM